MGSASSTDSLDDVHLVNATITTNESGSFDNEGGLLFEWDDAGVLYITRLYDIRLGICTLAFVVNVIVGSLQIKVKSHARTRYIFALTLTIADFIHAVAVFGETSLFRRKIYPLPIWCGAMVFASGLQSYLSILAVAFDRYLALCAIPFKYKQIITVKRYWITFVVMFSLTLTAGFVTFGSVSHRNVSLALTSFVFPTVMIAAICFVYIRLAYLVSKSLLAVKTSAEMKRRRAVKTRRIITAFSTLLAANVIFNMPQRLFGLYIALQPHDKRYNVIENVILTNWMYNVQTFNTCVNPLILWHQILVKEIQIPSTVSKCRYLFSSMQMSPDSRTSKSNDGHSQDKSVSVISGNNLRLSQSQSTGTHL